MQTGAAPDAQLGRVLGGVYALERKLGTGGMGTVYASRHLRTGRAYAVKLLLPELASDPDVAKRFMREAQAIAALGHAGIVAVHDFSVEHGTPYIVMDLLEGEDLQRRLQREHTLPWPIARKIFLEAADALCAAHAKGLVHRDLKPANLFLARRAGLGERVVVLDFGLVKMLSNPHATQLTADGSILGTPLYMSLEQARGEPVDPRADVYSLACILYEMLAGQTPYDAPTPVAFLFRLSSGEPTPLPKMPGRALPPGIDPVLMRALAPKRDDRFPTMAEFAAAVANMTESPVAARAHSLDTTATSIAPPRTAPSSAPPRTETSSGPPRTAASSAPPVGASASSRSSQVRRDAAGAPAHPPTRRTFVPTRAQKPGGGTSTFAWLAVVGAVALVLIAVPIAAMLFVRAMLGGNADVPRPPPAALAPMPNQPAAASPPPTAMTTPSPTQPASPPVSQPVAVPTSSPPIADLKPRANRSISQAIPPGFPTPAAVQPARYQELAQLAMAGRFAECARLVEAGPEDPIALAMGAACAHRARDEAARTRLCTRLQATHPPEGMLDVCR